MVFLFSSLFFKSYLFFCFIISYCFILQTCSDGRLDGYLSRNYHFLSLKTKSYVYFYFMYFLLFLHVFVNSVFDFHLVSFFLSVIYLYIRLQIYKWLNKNHFVFLIFVFHPLHQNIHALYFHHFKYYFLFLYVIWVYIHVLEIFGDTLRWILIIFVVFMDNQ